MAVLPAEPRPLRSAAPPPSVLSAVGLKLASIALFSMMSALIKWLGDTYPVGQIAFCRSFFALIPVFLVVHQSGGWGVLRTRRIGTHLTRSLTGMASMALSFTALSMLPLATTTAIGFAAPIFITVLAIPLLGETVRIYRWSAVLLGFLGVLVMVQPGSEGFSLGGAIALAATVFTAFAMISIRRMADSEPSVTIVFYFTLACTIAGALTLPFNGVVPGLLDAAMLVAVGLLGGFAQILMTSSYRHAPASVLAPFDYTAMLFALAIGYLVWGDLPTPWVLGGAALVIASGLFILVREHRIGLADARARGLADRM